MEPILDDYNQQSRFRRFGNFGERLLAYLIDAMVVGIPLSVVSTITVMPSLMKMMQAQAEDPETIDPEMLSTVMSAYGILSILSIVGQWLYYALMESSSWQATVGKKALGLKVTDMAGEKVTFGRASGRFFGKIVSGLILLIGYLMAAFTEKKQALHDMIASTLVYKE